MSGVKHTPGPWFEQTGFSDDVEITAESREGMVAICSMDLGFTGHIGVEQEANARLIAAAPCMFEALVEVLEALDVSRNGGEYPSFEAWEAKARDAITRATGDRPEKGGAL